MNAATLSPTTADRAQVADFVTRVREHLGDLTADESEELLGGLEADLAEQAAERGTLVLADPATYAAELRVADPLALAAARRAPAGVVGAARMDRRPAAGSAARAVGVPHRRPDPRAPLVGPAVLLMAIVVSVLIGQGRLWPGSGADRPPLIRLAMVGLTLVALGAPLAFQWPQHHEITDGSYRLGYRDGSHLSGLRIGAREVHNVYAYDASGQPLTGVQLFDQAGRPVGVTASSRGAGSERRVTCPWFNGSTALFNVFPLPEQARDRGRCQARATGTDGTPTLPAQPLAGVPPVTIAPTG